MTLLPSSGPSWTRCSAPGCGRLLRTDESRRRGQGPVCWARTHPAPPRRRRRAVMAAPPTARPVEHLDGQLELPPGRRPVTGRDWHEQAACRGSDERLWHPEGWYSGRAAAVRSAITYYCRRCPVRDRCLAEALSRPSADRWGVWGGVWFRNGNGKTSARRAVLDPYGLLPEPACTNPTSERTTG